MHHSHKPDLGSLALSWYLDESATDGSTPVAVVGGLLLDEGSYLQLEPRWKSLLNEFSLPALHLKDFGKDGKYADMDSRIKASIFSRASSIILELGIYTIECTVNHADHKDLFSRNAKKELTAYELCFIAAVIGNSNLAKAHGFVDVAIIMDCGNPYAKYVQKAYNDLARIQKQGHPLSLGTFTFGDDEKIHGLQCADVVSWGARRRAVGMAFPAGLESIEGILKGPNHRSVQIPKLALEKFVESMNTGTIIT
jgi:hypothetical protein